MSVHEIKGFDRIFDSKWRPLIGWTCGACIALYYIPQILIADYLWIKLSVQKNDILPFPIKSDDILNLVYILLSWGTLKTVEKKWGRSNY